MSIFRRNDRQNIEGGHRIYGVVVGIVTDNKNPDGKYMVKVRFPWLPNGDESGQTSEQSNWLRVCTFMAGNGRGWYCLPEVGDEVLVAFEHGDAASGYVIGSLWNKNDATHQDNKSGKNNSRALMSRSGHRFEFLDDKDDKHGGNILIKTVDGAKILVDDKDEKIDIYDKTGKNFIQVDGKNKTLNIKTDDKINLESKGDFSLKCDNLTIEAKTNITIKAGSNMDMKASSNFTLKAGSNGTVQAGSTLTVKGSTVNIN